LETKHQIEKILVPVDFSENSLNACRYALKIALETKADIFLFHAVYSPAFDLIEMTGNKTTRKKLKENVEQKLLLEATPEMEKFIDSLTKLPEARKISNDEIKSLIQSGSAKEEILSFSKEYQPDLIIMGTHGKDKSAVSMLGSITEYAINKLSFPILAVPLSIDYSALPKSLLYLTDFDETDFHSIKKLLEFTTIFKMNIHCAHIGGGIEERKRAKLEGMIEYFKTAYNNSSIQYYLIIDDKKKNIVQLIQDYIQQHNIDIVSLTHKKRNLLKKYFTSDLTKKIFHKVKLPLLVFRP